MTPSKSTPSVARELAPAGVQSAPNKAVSVFQKDLGQRLWGCCAAQREQAPSPRVLRCPEMIEGPRYPLTSRGLEEGMRFLSK